MRLRLSVRRNGIPEVKFLWTAEAAPDYTISRLVAAVNDVVPLESGEWGLEDYAVEYKDGQGRGFECLHFQVVADILKEDDEVLIRPLLEGDMRRRRLSGRHQISIDGRHLVDGISFGRPWLRVPVNRPAIELPPRKRARITYDTSDEDEDEDAEVEWEPDHEASDEDIDDEGGAELFDEFEEEGERLLLENGDAGSDLDEEEELRQEEEAYERARQNTLDRYRSRPDDEQGSEDEAHMEVRDSEVEQYLSDSEEEEIESDASLPQHTPIQKPTTAEGSQRSSQRGSGRAAAAKLSKFDDYVEQLSSDLGLSPPPRSRATPRVKSALANGYLSTNPPSSPPNFAPNARQLSERADDDVGLASSDSESSSSEDSSDADSSSGSDSESDSDSDVEMNQDGARIQQQAQPRTLEFSSSSDDSDMDESDTSSDSSSEPSKNEPGPDDSGSESDDDSSSQSSDDSDSSDSSSESSSDGGSSVSVEGVHQPPWELPKQAPAAVTGKPAQATTDGKTSKAQSAQAKAKEPVAAQAVAETDLVDGDSANGEGKKMSRTQKRNARRRKLKKHMRARNADETPDAQPSNEEAGTPSAAEIPNAVSPAPAPTDELLERKKALLNSIGAASSPPASPEKGPAKADSAPPTPAVQEAPATEEAPASAADNDKPAQRKSRIDLGAGRRLLFGALGMKNPKTKEDEDKLREEFAKTIKVPASKRQPNQESAPDTPTDPRELEDEDPDAWRSKINYTAVECAQEGIELSEPPFPFVQRWDPQQRADYWYGKKGRGGKGKRKQRDQAHYYDDNERAGKKRRVSGPVHEEEEYHGFDDTVEMEDTTVGQEVEEHTGGVEDTGMEGAGESEDDLPDPSEDMTGLPLLTPAEAAPGMVITWKQWKELSDTQWQPALESVTAVIVRVEQQPGSEPPTLHLLLAKRDRKIAKSKRYDPETGERIYEAFEAPDLDSDEEDAGGDEDDAVDNGNRSLSFNELMEPRIVQLPLESQGMLGSSFMSQVRYDEVPPSEQLMGESYKPLSMELFVPMSTDPIGPEDTTVQDSVPQDSAPQGEDSGTESHAAGVDENQKNGEANAGDTHPEPSGLATSNETGPALSSVGSVASGRRQLDPHALGAESMDFDDAVPDSVPFAQDLGTQVNGGEDLQDDDEEDEEDEPDFPTLSQSAQNTTQGDKIPWTSDNDEVLQEPEAVEEQESASVYEPSREVSEDGHYASEASEIDVNRQDEIRPAGGEESFFESEYAPSSPPVRSRSKSATAKTSANNNKTNSSKTFQNKTNGCGTSPPPASAPPVISQPRKPSSQKIAKTEKGTSSQPSQPSWLSQSSQRNGSVPPSSQGGVTGKTKKRKEKKAGGGGKGFVIPMGSQVIELVSTPEPEESGPKKGQVGGLLVEQEGEGERGGSIPKGPGWVIKKKNRRF